MIFNEIKAYGSIPAVKNTVYLNSAEVEAEAEQYKFGKNIMVNNDIHLHRGKGIEPYAFNTIILDSNEPE